MTQNVKSSTLYNHSLTHNNNILQELLPQERVKLNLLKSIGGLSKMNTKNHEVMLIKHEKMEKKERKKKKVYLENEKRINTNEKESRFIVN